MIKPNKRASPEGKQADLATLEEVSPFSSWRQHLSSGAGGGPRSGGRGRLKGGTIKLRRSRHHNPRPEGPVKLKNPPALRPVNPKNLHARRAIRHLQRRRRCRPLSESEHNPSTQPAAPAAPLFYDLRPKGATTTLGAEGPVKLKNLKNLRAGGPSTLTPRACPKAKPP